MLENKYYIPSLEEFHIGFEFEYKAAPRIDENDGYIKGVFNESWSIAAIKHRLVDYPIIRVKSLSKEDIESLGFNFVMEDKNNTKHFESLNFTGVDKINWPSVPIILDIRLEFYENGSIKIYNVGWDDLIERDNKETYYTLFSGYLENKSELKTIIRQCRINLIKITSNGYECIEKD